MDNYVNSKIKSIVDVDADPEYIKHTLKKFEILCQNNPEGFIREITGNRNSVGNVDSVFKDLKHIMYSSKIDKEIKRIVFYYTYYHDEIVRKTDLLNHKNRRKIYDVKIKKPNNYHGKVGDTEVQFRVSSKKDSVCKIYKIMEIYGIGLPYIDLNFKNILVTEKNQKTTTPIDKKAFLQILMILRHFNSNGLYVVFDRWNIRLVGDNYYLLNLEKVFSKTSLDYKRQIEMLLTNYSQEISMEKYKNNETIYDEVIRDLYL